MDVPIPRRGRFQFASIQGAAGQAEVLVGLCPLDRAWRVVACDVMHDDPIDRPLAVIIRGQGINIVVALQTAAAVGSGGATPANTSVSLLREVWVPPGFFFGGSCPVAAAQTLFVRAVWYDVELAWTVQHR